MLNKEDVILSSILKDNELCQAVITYLKKDYFDNKITKILFELASKYYNKYDTVIDRNALLIEASKLKNVNDKEHETLLDYYDELQKNDVNKSKEWFLQFAESFCRERAVYNAVQESIVLLEEDKNTDKLPFIFEEAVGITFDTRLSHNVHSDALERSRKRKEKIEKIATGWREFDVATGGGFERKTLNSFIGGTGVGKSLMMVALAANMLRNGYNVLYISGEMSEEKIADRFDANLLRIELDKLKEIPDKEFVDKVNRVFEGKCGQIEIKEYPTSSANVNHIKSLLQDLKQKKGFLPDVIFIDYINIFASARVNMASGSYTLIKAIAEELRALAVSTNTCMVTATQSVRGSQESSDIELSDTSESYALVHTLDYFAGIMQTPELAKQNKYYIKQLKSRYGDVNMKPFWFMGVDKPRMTVYNIESDDQDVNVTVQSLKNIAQPATNKTAMKPAFENKNRMVF